MAVNLSRVHSWCLTGTPLSKGTPAELEGPLTFVRVEPFDSRRGAAKKLASLVLAHGAGSSAGGGNSRAIPPNHHGLSRSRRAAGFAALRGTLKQVSFPIFFERGKEPEEHPCHKFCTLQGLHPTRDLLFGC